MKTDYIHSPIFEVKEIVVGKTVVCAVVYEVWMERVDLINSVDSMIDSISVILIHKQRILRINPNS